MLRGAEIRTFAPAEQDGTFMKRLAGIPTLRIHTDSQEWRQCLNEPASLTLGGHQTPLGPLLTIQYRIANCWLFVFADYGDPDLWKLLDFWAESRCAIVEVIVGLNIYRELLPVGDLTGFAGYRSELDIPDRSGFMEAVVRFLDNRAPELYVLSKTETGMPHPVVEVNLMATPSVIDSVTRTSLLSTVPKTHSHPTSQDHCSGFHAGDATSLH
ncbi:hypothetical protein AYM40_29170 [Paraburkholderia phytofirmans OLGA172]|uniref:Uncharacterized protein n=2 Tax=Paraburkholderia phytofirmans TaxID=261302 RepID=A0A160FT51_9BURK|nr:hypothetical protein AYM40_29170 [Paraburkholderia phytofirmans OLGA172]